MKHEGGAARLVQIRLTCSVQLPDDHVPDRPRLFKSAAGNSRNHEPRGDLRAAASKPGRPGRARLRNSERFVGSNNEACG